MVVSLHFRHVSLDFNMHHHLFSSFQNELNHPSSWIIFFFQSKIVESRCEMWNCYFIFQLLGFSQNLHLWGCDILSRLVTLINSIFSVIICIHIIHVFRWSIFTLSNCCYDKWKYVPFVFLWEPLLEKNPFIKSCSYQSRLSLKKKESDRWSLVKENHHNGVSCSPLLRTETLVIGSKWIKN